MSSVLRQVVAILWKDVTLDFRRKVEAGSALVFSAAAAVLTAYSLSGMVAGSPYSAEAIGTMLTMVFLSVYASLSSFVREADQGTLDGLRASPAPPVAVYVAKLCYTFIMVFVEVMLYLLLLAYFSQRMEVISPAYLGAVAASALYLSAASSFSSVILVYSEARGVLLPVTILVLVLPFIHTVTPVLINSLAGAVVGFYEVAPIALMALGFTVLVTVLSSYVLEAV